MYDIIFYCIRYLKDLLFNLKIKIKRYMIQYRINEDIINYEIINNLYCKKCGEPKIRDKINNYDTCECINTLIIIYNKHHKFYITI